ncbi:MAG TPA: histidine kinase, partial [Aquaticitalea sp.]|nr:histidine kinase [Aquaticitalea sp.]
MNKSIKYLYITFWISCAVYLAVNVVFGGFDYQSFDEFLIDFGKYQLYGILLGYSNYLFFAYLEKRL